MSTRLLGKWGEALAANFLRKKKYDIIGVNFKSRYGEIDLIACKGNILAFVEVKLRKSSGFAAARENVSLSKQRKIKTTAELWLALNECDLQARFDVVEIYAPNGYKGKYTIEHIIDAF